MYNLMPIWIFDRETLLGHIPMGMQSFSVPYRPDSDLFTKAGYYILV